MDQHEMILRDEKQRSWLVQLSKRSLRIAMTRGLHQFMKANGVQVGDTYKFELIDNKTMRVVHFPCELFIHCPSDIKRISIDFTYLKMKI